MFGEGAKNFYEGSRMKKSSYMIDIEIREAQRKDFETILVILLKNKLYTEDVDQFKLHEFLLATNNGNIVGCSRHTNLMGNFFIRSTAVVEEHRGKGIAKKLIEATIELAREKGVREVYASVLKEKVMGITLLEKSKFNKMSKEERYELIPICGFCRGDYDKMHSYCREHITNGCPFLTYKREI